MAAESSARKILLQYDRDCHAVRVKNVSSSPVKCENWTLVESPSQTRQTIANGILGVNEEIELACATTNDSRLHVDNPTKYSMYDEQGLLVQEIHCSAKRAKVKVDFADLDLLDQCIAFVNRGNDAVDISGWVVESLAGCKQFQFPDNSLLKPNEEARIWSGKAAVDRQPAQRDFVWTTDPVWNHLADTAILKDQSGSHITSIHAEAAPVTRTHRMSILLFDLQQEHVVVVNNHHEPCCLTDWTVRTSHSDASYRFPHGFTLTPGGLVRIWTGKRARDIQEDESNLIWTTDTIFNTNVDICSLVDDRGNVVSEAIQELSKPGLLTPQANLSVSELDLLNGCVEIRNNCAESVGMNGWTLASRSEDSFTFPATYQLQPFGVVRVWAGPYSKHKDNRNTDLHWTDKTVWADAEDFAALRDPNGRLVSKIFVDERARHISGHRSANSDLGGARKSSLVGIEAQP